MPEYRQCEQVKADGARCRGRALAGRPHCPFHDSTTKSAQAAGRRAGGQTRIKRAAVLPADAPDAALTTLPDVAVLLAETINQVRKGNLDTKVGNCVAVLAGQLVRAIQQGDVEQRLAAVEARQAGRDKGGMSLEPEEQA